MRSAVFPRLFVDVKNGEPFPRKSILKSRSRENSVCSDTSESSAADFEERRMIGRSFSHDDTTHSDTSDGITEEDSPTAVPLHPASRFEVNGTKSPYCFCVFSSRCLIITEQISPRLVCVVFNLNYSVTETAIYLHYEMAHEKNTPLSLRSLNENITKLPQKPL